MKITGSNAVGEVPRQILQLPLESEIPNVDEVDRHFSIMSRGCQTVTAKIDRRSQGGLYDIQWLGEYRDRSSRTTPCTTACSPNKITFPGALTNHSLFSLGRFFPTEERSSASFSTAREIGSTVRGLTRTYRCSVKVESSIAPASNNACSRSSRRSPESSIPTQRRIRSSGRPRAARVAGSIEACLCKERVECNRLNEGGNFAYDMTHGMLISEFTHPKLTLIPHNLVAATTFSLKPLSPVVKLRTAPDPWEIRSWISLSGWDSNPG